jgi:dolichol-phosphate mannosyltransferase
VLPVFNESKNLQLVYNEILKVIKNLEHRYSFEIIFVNDGSMDDSWKIIQEIAFLDARIRGFSFTRNFGHQLALMAGYDHASGKAIISMDADLQHPPHIIPSMLEAWKNGAPIVYAKNSATLGPSVKNAASNFFYRFFDKISAVAIPQHVQDFRLIDQEVCQTLRQFNERSPYLRGMVAWTGFPSKVLEVDFGQRAYGESGYSWTKMIRLAFDGITSFSLMPLRIAFYAGLLIIFTGLGMFAYITIDAVFFDVRYPLFKWLVTLIYTCVGLLFSLIWLLGEYIGRIYELVQGRPRYVLLDCIGEYKKTQLLSQLHSVEARDKAL